MKPSDKILKQAEKLGLRLKIKKNGKFVYKTEKVLKEQIERMKKRLDKKKVKKVKKVKKCKITNRVKKSNFGNNPVIEWLYNNGDDNVYTDAMYATDEDVDIALKRIIDEGDIKRFDKLQNLYNDRIIFRIYDITNYAALKGKYKRQPKLADTLYNSGFTFMKPDDVLVEATLNGDMKGALAALRVGATDIERALEEGYKEIYVGGPERERIPRAGANHILEVMDFLKNLKTIPENRIRTLERKYVNKLDLPDVVKYLIRKYFYSYR